MKAYHFLAFDLGATSGRSILGILQNGQLTLKELTRFPNKIIHIHNKYYWDLFALYESLKEGLLAVHGAGYTVHDPETTSSCTMHRSPCTLDSIGIDTWGVDFVYIGEDGSILSQPRSYRDPYTSGRPEEYFNLISRKEVYDLTGIQIMDFNSIYQLHAAKSENFPALKAAKNILFIPDALSYLLTGKQICEYTIASTSQILNPKTKQFESELLEVTGIDSSILLPVTLPGTIIGNLTESLEKETGLTKTPVIAVAGHDTASAVAAVPAEDANFAYLSSGTWSLMGIEVKEPIINDESFRLNFTNEGGVEGTTRFLKNITGLWLLEQCRKEWEAQGKKYGYSEIVTLAESAGGFSSRIDPDHSLFANPESMPQAIAEYCKTTEQKAPESHAEFIRCIFESLALKYKEVLDSLQHIAPFKIKKLHVIGGGSQNKLLNQLTANAIGIPVIAGPSEATAYGNILMQAKGLGIVHSLSEMRTIIRNSVDLEIFYPEKGSSLRA
jgi:rhamnulokinase